MNPYPTSSEQISHGQCWSLVHGLENLMSNTYYQSDSQRPAASVFYVIFHLVSGCDISSVSIELGLLLTSAELNAGREK